MSDTSNGNGKRRTLIEEETEFKGTLTSRCPVIVMGKLQGEIDAPSVHISGSGAVSGSMLVGELTSEGELAGEVEAESVRLSGRIKDSTVIRAKTLEVHLARESGKMEVVFGECELAVGDEPQKEAAIAAALAGESATPEPQPAADVAAEATPEPETVADVAAEATGALEQPAEEPGAAAASESAEAPPNPGEPDDWGVPDTAATAGDAPANQRKDRGRRQRRESQQPPPA